MNECVVCREEVFLPVEMTCFPCYRKNNICCSSFCRVCRKCAHDYLQLDKPVYHRDVMRRCLYCPSVCSTLSLTPNTAYRKDFLMIRADASVDHHCPYCRESTGTQLATDHHLETVCQETVVVCPCGVAMPRKACREHVSSCPRRRKCTVCDAFVLVAEMEDHMMNAHQHMRCGLCDEDVPYDAMTVHLLEQCRHRMVRCEYCHTSIAYHRIPSHMDEHEQYFQSMFSRLAQSAVAALRDYNHFRRIRNRLSSAP